MLNILGEVGAELKSVCDMPTYPSRKMQRQNVVKRRILPDKVAMSRGVKPIAAKFAMSASAVDKEEGSRAAAWSALDTIPSRRPSSTTQDGPPCCKQYNNIIIVHYVFQER